MEKRQTPPEETDRKMKRGHGCYDRRNEKRREGFKEGGDKRKFSSSHPTGLRWKGQKGEKTGTRQEASSP